MYETENEGTTEWMQSFYAGEECNLPGLAFFADLNICAVASPPTPHTNRGRVRPRRLDTAHSNTCHQRLKKGAMPLPLPAANEDLGRENEVQ